MIENLKRGLVRELTVVNGIIRAKVPGTNLHKVKIKEKSGESVLKKLASSIEQNFPKKAIEIHGQLTERNIDLKRNDGTEMRRNVSKKRSIKEWIEWVTGRNGEIRMAHKRKINL